MIATNVTIVFADDAKEKSEIESKDEKDKSSVSDEQESTYTDPEEKDGDSEENEVSDNEKPEGEKTDSEDEGEVAKLEDEKEKDEEEEEEDKGETETDKDKETTTEDNHDDEVMPDNETEAEDTKEDEDLNEDEDAKEDENLNEDEDTNGSGSEEKPVENLDSLTKLRNLFGELSATKQGDFNAGSWKMFIDKLEEVDRVLSNEDELAEASEEYIDDLIAELLQAHDSLEVGLVDATEVAKAYKAFQKKYQGINIADLMDFYEDGYYNQFMLDYIEEYITLNQKYVTTSENAHLLDFLAVLDESLEKELKKREKSAAKETSKKDAKKKKKPKKERLIKDEKIQSHVEKKLAKAEERPVQKASKLQVRVKSFNEVVVTPLGQAVTSTAANISNFRTSYVLPNTATPYYKYVVVGSLMIIEGLFLFLYFRFFSFVRKRFGFF